jgi:hypothetical protein
VLLAGEPDTVGTLYNITIMADDGMDDFSGDDDFMEDMDDMGEDVEDDNEQDENIEILPQSNE